MIKASKFIFIITLPLILLLGSVRLLAGDLYLAYEYGKSDFPPDPYGFTPSQRLSIASGNLRFVRENLAIEALSNQVLDGKPVYNLRELSHMLDVQNVYQSVGRAWHLIIFLTLLTGLLIGLFSDRIDLPSAILAGGFLTSGLIFVLGVLALVAWQGWFTAFHQIFFSQGSWLFEYTDTLIRLFPQKFWVDSTLTLLSISFIEGLLLAFIGWVWRRLLKPIKGKESNINHLNATFI